MRRCTAIKTIERRAESLDLPPPLRSVGLGTCVPPMIDINSIVYSQQCSKHKNFICTFEINIYLWCSIYKNKHISKTRELTEVGMIINNRLIIMDASLYVLNMSFILSFWLVNS